ncbi:hypothetical protein C0J52_16358 [Blattella germanica]|nr:hypothetical protein C0J52_16358 [Blattella germanica]
MIAGTDLMKQIAQLLQYLLLAKQHGVVMEKVTALVVRMNKIVKIEHVNHGNSSLELTFTECLIFNVFVVNPIFQSTSCSAWMFLCNNKKCVPYWWKCDGVNDCGDNSDEFGCGKDDADYTTPSTSIIPSTPMTCSENQFRCFDGRCNIYYNG